MSRISRKNPIPLHIQLRDIIMDKIETGEWQVGELIPTELELGSHFNLSRTTVRQALTALVSEGVLDRVQGKGTYVSKPEAEFARPDLTSFTQSMKEQGEKVKSVILQQGKVSANKEVQKILDLPSKSKVTHLERIRLVNEEPVGYQHAFLNLAATPSVELDKYDFSTESLYKALEKEDVVFGESSETIEARLAYEFESKVLNIPPGSLLLSLTRTTTLLDGTPFEYVTMFYRADKYKHSVKLR